MWLGAGLSGGAIAGIVIAAVAAAAIAAAVALYVLKSRRAGSPAQSSPQEFLAERVNNPLYEV